MSTIVDTLSATLQINPENWQIRLALVEALAGEGRTDEAFGVMNSVTELPADLDSQVMAGRAYGLLEPESGIQVLDQVIAANPSQASAYLEKARIYLAAGETEFASSQYQTALGLDPGIADPLLSSQLVPQSTPPPMPAVGNPLPIPAQAVAAPVPLVDPSAIPAHPELAYDAGAQFVETQYTPEAQFLEQVNNVDIHSAHYEEPVSYDYQQPDDSYFAPVHTADDISVAADDGVVDIRESIEMAKENEVLNRKKANQDRILAVLISFVSLALLLILLAKIVNEIPRQAPPQLTGSAVGPDSGDEVESQSLKRQVTQAPSAPSMSAEITTASAFSSVSMVSFESDSADFAMASMEGDFGASMSFEDEGGGMVSFFGSKATSQKVVFVVDASASMKATGKGGKKTKMELMKEELVKTVQVLPDSVEFQILFFSGPSWFLNLEPAKSRDAIQRNKAITNYNRNLNKSVKKDWSQLQGKNFWEYKGGNPASWPKQPYIKATGSNRRMAVDMIKKTPMMLGTDWRDPLKMAMAMEPDTIYFMTDGAVGKHPTKKPVVEDVLSFNRKHGKAKINTVCMMVLKASENLEELADKTGGDFTLVQEDGTVVRGTELKRLMRKK